MTRDQMHNTLRYVREQLAEERGSDFSGVKALDLVLEELEQEPKTGRWIRSNIPNEEYVCSECGGGCWYYDYQADVVKSRFCPNCGAKMER